jgi:malonate transporter and related proteins
MLNALIPVFSLILLGGLLKYLAFPGVEFWRGAERLTYYLLFPALLFLKLSTTTVSGDLQLLHLAILLIGILLIVSVILIIFGYLFGIHGAAFTSLYQGGIRFNTYVGLAVVDGLMGDSGLAMAAIVVGIMIPVVNLLCVSVFAYAAGGAGKGLASIIRNIVKNPLVIACILGILWNKLGWILPDLSISVLELISGTALPLGLLSVGAGVHFSALGGAMKPLFISSIIKLFIFPLLAYALCQIAGQGASVTMVITIIASLPTASSAYILSRELGGDSKTMAAIITGHTLFAMISMPLIINYFV